MRTMARGDNSHIAGVERQTLPVCLGFGGAAIGVVPAVLHWRYMLPETICVKMLWALRMCRSAPE
jgi:hypothetical protein